MLADAFLEGVPPVVGTFRGQCLNLRTTPEPYGPLLDALDRFVRLEPATRVDKLRHYAPSWLAQMPWLDADHARSTTPTESSTGHMLRELVRFTEEAARTPGVLVVEDLHWADPATVDAIATLVERLDRSPLLIVATGRSPAPEKFEPSLDATITDLEHRGLCVRMALQPLGVRSVS